MDASGPAPRLEDIATAIREGVERCLPSWVEREIGRILDAWGRLDSTARARADDMARAAGRAASIRIGAALRVLFETDPRAQTSTPLQIVRSAYREPTRVLEDVGVPPVVRDEFDERSWPDDRYGLVPRTLGDLGDPDLAPLHLAWGIAKTAVLRSG
jgi:hypothetical protein